jgi:hypothetical protein
MTYSPEENDLHRMIPKHRLIDLNFPQALFCLAAFDPLEIEREAIIETAFVLLPALVSKDSCAKEAAVAMATREKLCADCYPNSLEREAHREVLGIIIGILSAQIEEMLPSSPAAQPGDFSASSSSRASSSQESLQSHRPF